MVLGPLGLTWALGPLGSTWALGPGPTWALAHVGPVHLGRVLVSGPGPIGPLFLVFYLYFLLLCFVFFQLFQIWDPHFSKFGSQKIGKSWNLMPNGST